MALGTNYGNFQPQAVDPYPIESTLAQEIGAGNRGDAANLLNTYQSVRAMNQGNYNVAQQQQHDFAYQQLAQQMAEARLKEFAPIAKLPGGASFLASGGIPGMDMGGNPGALTNLAAAGDRAQAAENLQKSGAGMYSLVEAGYPPSADQASVATGGFSGPQGTPLSTINTQINANARIAAARLHAAGAQGSAMVMNYPVETPNGKVNVPIDTTKPMQPQIDTAEAWGQAQFARKGQPQQNPDVGTQPAPVANKRPMGGQVSGVPATQTNVPNAPSGGNARLGLPPGHSVLPTNTPEGIQAQKDAALALNGIKTSNPQLYELIRPRGGAVFDLRKAPDGTVYTIGRDGRPYGIASQKQAAAQ